ncbi:unnamed protein product [Aphanomyces euteiches]
MQVEPYYYQSIAPHQQAHSTMYSQQQPPPTHQQHHCRGYTPNRGGGGGGGYDNEVALPPLQSTFSTYANQTTEHSIDTRYATTTTTTAAMNPQPYYQPPTQAPTHQLHQAPPQPPQYQQPHYDPYPHASYNYQYNNNVHMDRNKQLDPALLEEALNECMPFIEPMMGVHATTAAVPDPRHVSPPATAQTMPRYDTYDANVAAYMQSQVQSGDAAVYSPSNDSQRKGEKSGGTSTQRLCRVAGCNKGIRSRGLCKGHGGGRRCQTAGCKISDQGGGHCIAHGGGRRCSVKDCTRSAQARGLCKCHGGGRPCKYAGCTKNSQRSGYCMAHGKLMATTATLVKAENVTAL